MNYAEFRPTGHGIFVLSERWREYKETRYLELLDCGFPRKIAKITSNWEALGFQEVEEKFGPEAASTSMVYPKEFPSGELDLVFYMPAQFIAGIKNTASIGNIICVHTDIDLVEALKQDGYIGGHPDE